MFIKFIYFEKKHQLNAEAYNIDYANQKQMLNEEDLLIWQNANAISAHIFSQNDNFCPLIKVLNPIKIADNGQSALDDLKIRVDAAYANLPTVSQQDLDKIKTDLATLGITPQNTYLFIQGHTLYDNVVKPILNTVADNLKSKKLVEFATNAKHDTQAKDKQIEYKKVVFKAKNDELTTVERSWFNAKYYAQCPFTTKIENDIKRYKSIT
ncbi:MAG: hypothetical protein RLZZ292_1993 [Bacteroidota bacterium]